MASRPSKPTKGANPGASGANFGANLSARRKSVALRTGSFDEQQLQRAEREPSPASAKGSAHLAAPGGTSSPHSPKFFRTQSFGDRLLASSPKFVKSKKIFLSVGPKSSSSTALFFAPEVPATNTKGSPAGGSSFGSRRKNVDGCTGRPPAHIAEPTTRVKQSTDGDSNDPVDIHDPLIAFRDELRQLRQLQKERFRSRSSSISVERWNENASGQR
ncbi:hypothetical protein ZHAS_00021102 [Anopheles sinensis]|uniref:Uncharacterized protein n=1 Tax=Anopheles sinensis TaxID=74873 RepID=A0A084WRI9_ANOSI|nr:hypothetical protein ZHAS_00021102 [Anopheles sinensis]